MSQTQPRLRTNLGTFVTGYDGGSSGSDSEGPNEPLGEKAPFPLRTPLGAAPPQSSLSGLPGPCLPDFWLIVRVLQDRVDVYAHARWVGARAHSLALPLTSLPCCLPYLSLVMSQEHVTGL